MNVSPEMIATVRDYAKRYALNVTPERGIVFRRDIEIIDAVFSLLEKARSAENAALVVRDECFAEWRKADEAHTRDGK